MNRFNKLYESVVALKKDISDEQSVDLIRFYHDTRDEKKLKKEIKSLVKDKKSIDNISNNIISIFDEYEQTNNGRYDMNNLPDGILQNWLPAKYKMNLV